MMKMKNIFAGLLFLLISCFVFPLSLIEPEGMTASSQSLEYLVRLDTVYSRISEKYRSPEAKKDTDQDKYFDVEKKPEVTFFKFENGSYKRLNSYYLINNVSPELMLLSNEKVLITFDDWPSSYSEKDIVIYAPDGKVRKIITGEKIYGKSKLNSLLKKKWGCGLDEKSAECATKLPPSWICLSSLPILQNHNEAFDGSYIEINDVAGNLVKINMDTLEFKLFEGEGSCSK